MIGVQQANTTDDAGEGDDKVHRDDEFGPTWTLAIGLSAVS